MRRGCVCLVRERAHQEFVLQFFISSNNASRGNRQWCNLGRLRGGPLSRDGEGI